MQALRLIVYWDIIIAACNSTKLHDREMPFPILEIIYPSEQNHVCMYICDITGYDRSRIFLKIVQVFLTLPFILGVESYWGAAETRHAKTWCPNGNSRTWSRPQPEIKVFM